MEEPRRRRSPLASILGAVTVMAATLAIGCGSDETTADTAAASGDTAPARTLTIGLDTTVPPYGIKEGGELSGLEAELARAMGEAMGADVEIVDLKFANAVPSVQSGRVDATFVGGFAESAERREQMNLVDYLRAFYAVLVPAGNPKDLGGFDSMCGTTGATYTSSPFLQEVVREADAGCRAAGEPGVKLSTYPDVSAGALAVRSGKADFWVDSKPTAGYIALNQSELEEVVLPDEGVTESYVGAFGLSKDNLALAEEMAAALQTVVDSGRASEIAAEYGLDDGDILDEITVNGGQ